MLRSRFAFLVSLAVVPLVASVAVAKDEPSRDATEAAVTSGFEFSVLATKKTSTMQKEMNEAAEQGYRFGGVMGGETSFGGSEVVVVMQREAGTDAHGFEYRLLATAKTSTMQNELQEAADKGFNYRGQTVFKTTFGGSEVVVILERSVDAPLVRYEYKLLATSKTSTMQKELTEVGAEGFELVGMTVAETALGGSELVSITRRAVTD